jgi:hypothetical protein
MEVNAALDWRDYLQEFSEALLPMGIFCSYLVPLCAIAEAHRPQSDFIS